MHNLRTPNIRWQLLVRNTADVQLSLTALTIQKLTLVYNNLTGKNWFHSLPSQRFQALLTLFPKFFSSFPHGTCLLSVLDLYLALEDNYLPFCTPCPKCATRWCSAVRIIPSTCTGFSPSLTLCSKETYAGACASKGSQDYNSQASLRFTSWALPGSVALTKGIIFIFFSSAYLYA